MTVAVDTNVLIRYLTLDNPAQAQTAANLLESGEPLWISTIVLCEAAWVLKRTYDLTAQEIGEALATITAPTHVGVEDDEALAAGLRMLKAGGDFADGCILHLARRSKAQALATFDKALARRGGNAVRLLASA